jgi:hypothetical protein
MTNLGLQVGGTLQGRRISQRSFAEVERAGELRAGTIINTQALDAVIRRSLPGKFDADPGIRYGDGSYYLPEPAEIQQILANSQVDRRTWLAERFDCDDFAYVLKGEVSIHAYDTGTIRFGLAFGMVWGFFDWVKGFHAVNWFIASDGVLRFVEPQQDTIYDASHCQGRISLLIG